MAQDPGFQRARRPEQREQRRRVILDATEELLSEIPIDEISLRELSRRLGTSKTNVIRYFETREGVLLALLNRSREAWLDALEERLSPGAPGGEDVLRVLAESLAEQPLLCQLWSRLPTVLERNVSAETVLPYKLTDLEHRRRLAQLIRSQLPALGEDEALHLTRFAVVGLVGLWPFSNPAPSTAEVLSDPRLVDAHIDFVTAYTDFLRVSAAGLLAGAGDPLGAMLPPTEKPRAS
ncbi:TetR family transcriptional regulator [Streptomyces sp. NPDC004324]